MRDRREIKSGSEAKALTRSAGNVFADLGFSSAEAENLRLRAELMSHLTQIIERRGLTQSQAAKLLHVAQPRISDLVCGKIHLFSVDTLIAMIGHAGAKVGITIHAAKVA